MLGFCDSTDKVIDFLVLRIDFLYGIDYTAKNALTSLFSDFSNTNFRGLYWFEWNKGILVIKFIKEVKEISLLPKIYIKNVQLGVKFLTSQNSSFGKLWQNVKTELCDCIDNKDKDLSKNP